jgi:hypothetical protein
MTADGFDEHDRARGRDPRRPHRSSRPLWLGGMPQPEGGDGTTGRGRYGAGAGAGPYGDDGPDDQSVCCDACDRPHDPDTCGHCAQVRDRQDAPGLDGLHDFIGESAPEPDLGEIVVILLVSTLAGLRDRLERDGFASAAGLVHDLVEVADDYVMRFQP